MKKSIIMAVLGVAASVATSYGQGYIYFSSYVGSSTVSQFVGGALVDSPYVAELYYAIGTVTDTVNNSLASSITSDPTGFTLLTSANLGVANTGTYPAAVTSGQFDGVTLVVPGYSSGAITFEVVYFNGTTYDTSMSRGRSGSFTMTSIRTDGVASQFGDNGQNIPSSYVAAVPEPTTLALAGLGGLASLVALRRKQA